MKIGFIGLGNLGTAIAENLAASETLYIYNRTASKAQAFAGQSAIVCSSVAEVALQCDVVFSIVSDDAALNHVTMGEHGLAVRMKPGSIHVSMSTVLPETAQLLADLHRQHGSHYVACPVMARPEVARARRINFLVSGDYSSIDIIKPLLQKAGAIGIWDFGTDPAAANVAKLCSNYLILAAMEAMAEGINLAARSNIDPRQWMQMLTQTYFNAPAYINYSKLILDHAFEPAAFSLKLGLKDMNLVLQQANSVRAAMPVASQVQSLLQQALAAGWGDQDVVAISKIISDPVPAPEP